MVRGCHHKGARGTCAPHGPFLASERAPADSKEQAVKVQWLIFFPSFHHVLQAFCENKELNNKLIK